jgi:predicted RNase H-like HicB family nuclease
MIGLGRGVTREYSVLLLPDEEQGGYAVKVPALPGIVTQGETVDEALAMARDVIAVYLEDLVADGKLIPTETVQRQLATVSVAV